MKTSAGRSQQRKVSVERSSFLQPHEPTQLPLADGVCVDLPRERGEGEMGVPGVMPTSWATKLRLEEVN